jgi:hypothetical protein
MKIVLDEKETDQLVSEVMESFPEYSSPSLRCISWKYKDMIFKFHDVEEDKIYILDAPKLRKGMAKLLQMMGDGKLPGISRYVMPDVMDAGSWDADAADALVQCAIFDDVIYG